MTDDIKKFKNLLQQRRDELAEVSSTGVAAATTVVLDQSRMGRLTRMDALQAQAMSQAANARRELELRRIAAALNRIERGNYGECLSCGIDIPEPRLSFDPAATLCVSCAEAASQ